MVATLISFGLADIIAFAATNIDDYVILIVLFARAGDDMSNLDVVVGQFVGFSIINILSLLGLVLGLFVPDGYIGLMGFVPILFGTYKLYSLVKERCFDQHDDNNHDVAAPPTTAGSSAVELNEIKMEAVKSAEAIVTNNSARPILRAASASIGTSKFTSPDGRPLRSNSRRVQNAIIFVEREMRSRSAPAGIRALTGINAPSQQQQNQGQEKEESEEGTCLKTVRRLFGPCLTKGALSSCLLTLANSGDNVAIYLPLFASTGAMGIVEFLVIFYFLLAVWCLAAYAMVNVQIVADFLEKYGEVVVPFCLIGIGTWVLDGSVAWVF